VTDTVENVGVVPARTSKVQYYLSLNTQKENGDKLLSGARSVPQLTPGDTSTGGVTVTVPSNTVPGTYFLLACADNAKVVGESHEQNNCQASATQVSVSP
jgi:uncharacterized membrane protein